MKRFAVVFLSVFLSIFLSPASVALAGSTEPIVTEGVISAPVAEVWQAWTTKEGMESWMVAKTDFVLGLATPWRTNYDANNSLDDETTIHQQTLAYDPERMFAFRTVKAPQTFPFPNAILKTWTVVYFEPVDAGHTKVTIRMHGYTEDEESQKMRTFFTWGNKVTLDDLVKKFAATPAGDRPPR